MTKEQARDSLLFMISIMEKNKHLDPSIASLARSCVRMLAESSITPCPLEKIIENLQSRIAKLEAKQHAN